MTVTWSLSDLFSRTASKQTDQNIDRDLERWRILLYWAAQTPYYWERSGMLSEAARMNSVAGVKACLQSLPPVPLNRVLANPKDFRSGCPRSAPRQPAWTFWETPARIALVQPWYRAKEPVRTFPAGQPLAKTAQALDRYQPDVMVATPGQLLRLARFPMNSPRRAIIAVQGPGMRSLTEGDRDLLWHRFGVPLYQQLRGFQGELLGAECDAQVGFHTNPNAVSWETRQQALIYTSLVDLRHPVVRLASGWYGDLEISRCGCGCLSPRLFPYERQIYKRTIPAKGVRTSTLAEGILTGLVS